MRALTGLLTLLGCVEPASLDTARQPTELPGDALRSDPDTGSDCPSAPVGSLGAPIDIGPAEPWRALGWAAVRVDGAGTADIEVDGPFEVFDAAGRPTSRLRLPGVLRVRASAGGDGALTLRQPGCAVDVPLRARPALGLSAGPLADGPVGRHVDAFFDGDALYALVDPAWHPELVGRTAWAFVVADRDRDDWLADPALVDARGGPWPVAIGSTAALHPLGRPVVARSGELVRYDLVLDVDGDGRLGPGDLIDGLDGPGFIEVPDLAAPGPRPVASVDHPAAAPTRRVFFPADVRAGGPEPLVVFSHGIGHTWQMYDHLGAHLASWGYVVVVHENNVGPGPNTAAVSTLAAADALLSDPGAVHPDLVDRIDARRIALIGHSRGGEGVFRALASLASGAASPSAFGLADVRLVSGVAPTVLRGTSDLVDSTVPLHLLVGSADGDVTGGVFQPQSLGDCAACQWFRLLQRGAGPQVVAYVHGATHNAFTCDGPGCGVDDGASVSGPKLTRPEVHAFMQAHYTAVLGHFVRGDDALGELLRRAGDDVPWALPDGFPVAMQVRPAPADAQIVDDFQTEPAPDRSSRGAVVRGDVDALVEGPLDDANTTLTWTPADPMNGMTWSHGDDPRFAARGAVFEWGAPARLEFELPAGERDLTALRALSVRIAQATRHPRTVSLDDRLELAIGLVDRTGREVTLPTAPYTRVTAPYPRTGDGAGTGWINEFNSIRIAIPDFATADPAFDLTHVQSVRLRFGAPWGSPEGRIGLDDLLFEAR